MSKDHQYTLSLEWTGNKGNGTSGYRTYDRSHAVISGEKTGILCSSDPAFRGDPTRYNPEELLVASISSCHMLWYLHLCAEAGVIVTAYRDNATGIMRENADGSGAFSQVTLNPEAMVTERSMLDKAIELHKKANEMCFIANSVVFPVRHHPIIKVDH